MEERKGYKICENYKTKWFYNKLSGHWWSEHIILKGFHIIGLGVFSSRSFGSIKKCIEHIDYLIRNNLNRSYTHITRKTHPQYYKEVV